MKRESSRGRRGGDMRRGAWSTIPQSLSRGAAASPLSSADCLYTPGQQEAEVYIHV